MRNQFTAELLKARSDKTIALLVGVATFLDVLSILGNGSKGTQRIADGVTTPAVLSHDLVRLGFANLLFAMIFGIVAVTGEYRSGAVNRTVLLARRRGDILAAKAAVSLIVGLLLGLCGIATSLVTSAIEMRHVGHSLVLDRESLIICAGIVLVCALSGPWGAFIGWIGRNQLVTVVAALVWMLVAESALINFVPAAGRFLPGGAQAAIYRDTGTPETLSMPVGIVLFLGWIGVAGWLASRLFERRDLT